MWEGLKRWALERTFSNNPLDPVKVALAAKLLPIGAILAAAALLTAAFRHLGWIS